MRRSAITVLTAAALFAGAAPALADYPVPFTPAETVTQAAENNGFAVESVKKADAAPTVAPAATGKPTKLATVKADTSVAPKLSGLPKGKDVVLKVVIGGKHIILGFANTGKAGTVQFPAVSFDEPGNYTMYAMILGTTKKFSVVVPVK